MSIIFRLAGNKEYNEGRVPAHNQAIDEYFGPFKDHDAVQIARGLRYLDGVSHDAPMSLAEHVKDVESLAEVVPLKRCGALLPTPNSRSFSSRSNPSTKSLTAGSALSSNPH